MRKRKLFGFMTILLTCVMSNSFGQTTLESTEMQCVVSAKCIDMDTEDENNNFVNETITDWYNDGTVKTIETISKENENQLKKVGFKFNEDGLQIETFVSYKSEGEEDWTMIDQYLTEYNNQNNIISEKNYTSLGGDGFRLAKSKVYNYKEDGITSLGYDYIISTTTSKRIMEEHIYDGDILKESIYKMFILNDDQEITDTSYCTKHIHGSDTDNDTIEVYQFGNNEWVYDSQLYIYKTYFEDGSLKSQLNYGATSTMEMDTTYYIYNEKDEYGNYTTEIYKDNALKRRTYRTYNDNGEITKYEYFSEYDNEYSSNNYHRTKKWTYNENGMLTLFEHKYYIGDNVNDNDRIEYVYNDENNISEKLISVIDENGVEKLIQTSTYEYNDNLISNLIFKINFEPYTRHNQSDDNHFYYDHYKSTNNIVSELRKKKSDDGWINQKINYTYETRNFDYNGIEGNSNLGTYSIYPNPSNGYITIKTDIKENSRLELFTISGMKVLETIINNNSKVDLNNLENGMYLYRIMSENQPIQSSKLILNK